MKASDKHPEKKKELSVYGYGKENLPRGREDELVKSSNEGHPTLPLEEKCLLPPSQADEGVPSPARRRAPRLRPRAVALGACVLLFLGLAGIWLGMFSAIGREEHLPATPAEWGQTVCGMLLCQGLPDLKTPLWQKPGGEASVESAPQETQPTETTSEELWLTLRESDMSLSYLGASHWEGEAGCVPPSFGHIEGVLTPDKRGVLVVCSRPYAVYVSGDEDKILLAENESLAVNVPADGGIPPKGTAALAQELTALLQDAGVEATLLPWGAGMSYSDTYAMSCTAVKAYLALHPEIGLVVDVSRSAELLPNGDLPRSLTEWEGVATAQLRVDVDTGRGAGVAVDYTLAMALRGKLFELSPTVSRPVYLRRGEGLTRDARVAVLTLSIGTAGNTYDEAKNLLSPLVQGLTEVLGRKG